MIFIDNIIVATDTKEGQPICQTRKVLVESKRKFLGMVISPQEVEIQKEKVDKVLSWPAPKNIKEVQKFLGLVNYYRQFIKDFARIIALLHQLVRKEEKWKWEKKQVEAFKRLKKVFTTELVLAILDLDKEMRVKTNTSDYTIEKVLLVKYENEK